MTTDRAAIDRQLSGVVSQVDPNVNASRRLGVIRILGLSAVPVYCGARIAHGLRPANSRYPAGRGFGSRIRPMRSASGGPLRLRRIAPLGADN